MGATAACLAPRQTIGMSTLTSFPNMGSYAGIHASETFHCIGFLCAGVTICSLRHVQRKTWQCRWRPLHRHSQGSSCRAESQLSPNHSELPHAWRAP
jgi:hypothetical protein